LSVGTPSSVSWVLFGSVFLCRTPEAEALSKALKVAGMNFVGPTTCYAFMQAAGLVNDHLVSCSCYKGLAETSK
jgi:DNA-3-methyladenine glycosylase I